MKKKKIVMLCSCYFTRVGIEALVNHTHLADSLEIVASINSVKQYELLLDSLPVIDIVLLVLHNGDYNLASILNLIGQGLPQTHASRKIVMMGKVAHMGVLKHYFSGLENIKMILKPSISLEQLQEHMLSISTDPQQKPNKAWRISLKLSRRELLVLGRLLDGESANQIAEGLKLHCKTVSHYKRSALAKLGVRSLCPLVVNLHNHSNIHHGLSD